MFKLKPVLHGVNRLTMYRNNDKVAPKINNPEQQQQQWQQQSITMATKSVQHGFA